MDFSALQGQVPDLVYSQIQDTIDKFDISTAERLSHFLGQCNHESENFTKTEENLDYSSQALWSIFHKHFASQEEANSYARQPEKIANRIYANRLGNGDEASGDGWLHRGKGYIQDTGKDNQQAFFNFIGIDPDSDPDLIATTYPLLSAAYFWHTKNLNAIADEDSGSITTQTATKITEEVNGGTLGLSDRIALTQKYWNILNQPSV